MTSFEFVGPRVDAVDVPRLYIEARAAGLEVSHYPARVCQDFDGSPEPGCVLGVFRLVGSLIFYKDERRWEVRANADCGTTELATLITVGLVMVAQHGREPGHFTRRKTFRHTVSKRTSKRIAYAGVAYKLNADDLLAGQTATTEVPVDLSACDWIEVQG